MKDISLIKAYYRGVREGLLQCNPIDLKHQLEKIINEEQEMILQTKDLSCLRSSLGYSRIGLNQV